MLPGVRSSGSMALGLWYWNSIIRWLNVRLSIFRKALTLEVKKTDETANAIYFEVEGHSIFLKKRNNATKLGICTCKSAVYNPDCLCSHQLAVLNYLLREISA